MVRFASTDSDECAVSAQNITTAQLSGTFSPLAQISNPKIDVLIDSAGENGRRLDLQQIQQV